MIKVALVAADLLQQKCESAHYSNSLGKIVKEKVYNWSAVSFVWFTMRESIFYGNSGNGK